MCSLTDNLKKLVFRFCPFPGMSKLESAWSQAAEMAADDAAVALRTMLSIWLRPR